MGLNLAVRVFHKPQQAIKENEEKKIRDVLFRNYQDSLNAMAIYRAGDAKKLEAFEEVAFNVDSNEIEDYFWYITEGRNERPLWVNNVDKREKPLQTDALIQSLPVQFTKNLVPPRKGGDCKIDKISVVMISVRPNELT